MDLRAKLGELDAAQNRTPRDQYTRNAHKVLLELIGGLIEAVEQPPALVGVATTHAPAQGKSKFSGWRGRG